MNNRIKEFRQAKKLTQKQLAEIVGTSQQQIQRMEAGQIEVRMDMAAELCGALEKPFVAVFPNTVKLAKKLESVGVDLAPLPSEVAAQFRAAGLESDLAVWTLRVLLSGHEEHLLFRISSVDKDRLFSAVQGERSSDDLAQFIVFDTDERRVALNLEEICFCQFLFDSPRDVVNEQAGDKSESDGMVHVRFSGHPRIFEFAVEMDEGEPYTEDDEGQCRHIFYMLDADVPLSYRHHLEDEDGESVFFRTGALAMFSVPLWVVEPDESVFADDEDDEPRGTIQ